MGIKRSGKQSQNLKENIGGLYSVITGLSSFIYNSNLSVESKKKESLQDYDLFVSS